MDLAEVNQVKATALLHTLDVPLEPALSDLLDEIIEKALRALDVLHEWACNRLEEIAGR